MKYKIIILFFVFFISKICLSSNLLNEGIELYKSGKFSEARDKFLSLHNELLEKKLVSSEVLYNIGNCYFRENKLGLARYYYELAKLANFHDSDINYNIKFIKKITKNDAEESFIEQILNFISFKETLILLFIFNILFFCSLIFENFVNFVEINILKWIKRISILFLLIFLVLSIIKYNYENQIKGIVLEQTDLLSAPEESSLNKSVSINEAKKVIILSEKDNFYAVHILQDKIQGWIKKHKVGILKLVARSL
jgi:hypothetical protein